MNRIARELSIYECRNDIYCRISSDIMKFDRFNPVVMQLSNKTVAKDEIFNLAAFTTFSDGICLLFDNGENYEFVVYRGDSGKPVYSEEVSYIGYEIEKGSLELSQIVHDDKFLGIGTYAESKDDGRCLGSSVYLSWDGERYNYEVGSLDRWLAGEQDAEYKVVDGKLVRKVFSGGYEVM